MDAGLAGEDRARRARLANPEHALQRDPWGARPELEGDADPHTVAAMGELQAGQHSLLKRCQPQRHARAAGSRRRGPARFACPRRRCASSGDGSTPGRSPALGSPHGRSRWRRVASARAGRSVKASEAEAVVAAVGEVAGRWWRRRRWRWRRRWWRWRWRRWWRRRWWGWRRRRRWRRWWRRRRWWRWWRWGRWRRWRRWGWRRWGWRRRRLNRLEVAEVAVARVGRLRDVHRPSAPERAAGRRTGSSWRAVVRIGADHRGGTGALTGFLRQQRLPQRVRAVGRADVVDHVLAFTVGDRERFVGVAQAVVVVVGPDLPPGQSGLARVALTVRVEIVELRPRRRAAAHGERHRGDVVLHVRGLGRGGARVHPDRAEGEAGLVEPLPEDLAEVQRRLAEALVGDRAHILARQERTNLGLVDGALSVDIRREARGVLEVSRGGTPARRVGLCRDPALDHDADVVALRLVRDEHVSGAPAWNRGPSVVPQPRVVVELERDERRRGARSCTCDEQ